MSKLDENFKNGYLDYYSKTKHRFHFKLENTVLKFILNLSLIKLNIHHRFRFPEVC